MAKKTYILLAVLLIAVVSLVAIYYLPHKDEASKNNTTTTFTGSSGLEACGKGPALAVVYGPGQERLAEQLVKLLRNQLSSDLPADTMYCSVSADKLQAELRVLPAILIRADNVSERLAKIISYDIDIKGFHPVRYDVVSVFAYQVAINTALPTPTYNVEATLVVVQGSIPETRVNIERLKENKRVMDMLAALFAAKIKDGKPLSIEEAEAIGVNIDVRPMVVAYSQEDLAYGTEGIVRIADNYYSLEDKDLKKTILYVFTSQGLTRAFEIINGAIDVSGHPSIGSGPVHIVIFEDFACPYCARFYREVMPEIDKMISDGKVTLHIMDLIVHREVEKLHTLLYCYYNRTGDGEAYLGYVKKVYTWFEKLMSEYQQTSNTSLLTSGYEKLARQLEQELGIKYSECEWAKQVVEKSTQEALSRGLTGTPSFIIWREGSNIAYYVIGFRDANFFKTIVASLLKQ